ncbi:two-component system, response regulator YesN [Paenibacillus sp. 1_12]|uniref:response regulator n=1 Tax=Paenibacillus sp. 1_12 TaxID=1566278 RepID=UPI0008DEBC27|nr:response regulator [Paenibacillus sp. 1_12]SFL25767.1 two-component system, response regulator YesN [Paenibacillus sp. 1_12]
MSRIYKVILVDDEPIILRSLKVALPWEDMQMQIVGEASNGEQGLKLIQAHKPDIVISDIRMPVMDGISMMKEALHQQSSLVFVLLSGYGEFEYAREALRYGASDYLLKPVDHEELEAVMREARKRLEQEAELQSEKDYLTRSAQALSSLLRERLISSMLEGNNKPYNPTYWLQGWDLEHPYVMLIVGFDDTLEVNRWSQEDRKLWFFAVGNVLGEYGGKRGALTVFPFRSGEWVLLLQNGNMEEAEQTAREIITLVKICTKLSCSVGISRQHSGLDALFACYRSAQQALLARFTGGRERVYADTGDTTTASAWLQEAGAGSASADRSASAALLYWEQRLTEAIAGFDRSRVSLLLEELINELRNMGKGQADAAAMMIELVVGVSRRLSDLSEEPLTAVKELISHIPLCGTLDELELLLRHALLEYTGRTLRASAREDEVRTIQKAIDYISGRFHHDLSIDEVSEFIGLSCSHFCVLFKKESGVTFLEYVTKLRIERACSILRNTDVKVYQIAPLVGYQDAKYFTQVFRKMIGMTPSEYRATVQVEIEH